MIKPQFKKVRSQAMHLALLVAAVVALLLSSFLALTHMHTFFGIKSTQVVSLVESTNKAVFKTIDEDAAIVSLDTLELKEGDKVSKIVNAYNGAWIKTYVKSSLSEHKSFERAAYIGTKSTLKMPNLYLKDGTSPLILVGNTRLEGNCYLPRQGVKSGTIAGNYYQNSQLIYGNTYESTKELPKLNQDWIAYLDLLLQKRIPENSEIIPLSTQINNSFFKKTKFVYSSASIFITDQSINGNVIVKSDNQIVVSATAKLTDVILVAPKITISNGFKGIVQAIASKEIRVGERCALNYPSSVTVLKDLADKITTSSKGIVKEEPFIIIKKGAVVQGSVAYLEKGEQDKKFRKIKTHLKIETNTEVLGEVYCQGNTELLGVIKGALYSNQFIANQYGSVFINHLYNGKVLRNPIPDYSGLPFPEREKTIAKWMY